MWILRWWQSEMLWLLATVGLAAGATVRLSVIAPEKEHTQALPVILPIIELAVRDVSDPSRVGLLPGANISLVSKNSSCSSTYGPLAAMQLYNHTDAFLGPVCDYVIAPVSRYAGVWGKPVITAGGQADHFIHKQEYPTLTRVMGSYGAVSIAMRHILNFFEWKVAGMLFFDYGPNSSKGHSKCFLMLGPVFTALGANSIYKNFNDSADKKTFKELLQDISKSARIVVVCADPPVVREILLVAEELNMIDSGEYVFFNIELFNNQYNMHKPWYVKDDPPDRNKRAKKAFTALLTVTARTPDSEKYRNFSNEIKVMAKERYNYTFGPDPVSTFVTAFYDAVILYAIALNKTLSEGGSQSDGIAITKKMWNTTFEGITGEVTVDANGDRITDYSLLDMDPESGEFRIVAHYIGKSKQVVTINETKIHWSGGRTKAPPDTPACGFDNSLCKSMPIYAILSIALGSVVVVLFVASAMIYRSVRILRGDWYPISDLPCSEQ